MINISELDRADVLAALYNASKPQGMGFMHYDSKPMSRDEAIDILIKTRKFDYLKGRVMKISLESPDEFDGWLYDRDNGEGKAQWVIDQLIEGLKPEDIPQGEY